MWRETVFPAVPVPKPARSTTSALLTESLNGARHAPIVWRVYVAVQRKLLSTGAEAKGKPVTVVLLTKAGIRTFLVAEK